MILYKNDERPRKMASSDYFTGTVWADPINDAPEPARARSVRVTFEAGARTNWHTHPLGQTLYVIAGEGRFQTLGQPVRVLRQGDTVWIPPGEKHWHGASSTTAMSHIAIHEALDGVHINWMEPVSDDDFNRAPEG
jgi:quercetin dioxygenase-like cupin family protein